MSDSFEIFAMRYGELVRRSPENFVGGDTENRLMPLDYFVWVIKRSEEAIIVDTGFSNESGARRGRKLLKPIAEGLHAIGVEAGRVRDVILTHLHYDHAGNTALFPGARYHVQEREMAFCTGPIMCARPDCAHHYEAEDIQRLVRDLFEGRLNFHAGDSEFMPGITLHHIGGHTDGLQAVRVRTGRGWVLLASDATHFYANLETDRPFPSLYDLEETRKGFRRLRALASSDAHIIPGHDPEVLRRFPPAAPGLAGWIARVDLPPLA